MIGPVNAELRELAGFAATGGPGWQVASRLLELADRGDVVVLPAIDPDRDDLRHWREIDRTRLAAEIDADAWNLAAGVHVNQLAPLAAVRDQPRPTSRWAALRADVRALLSRS